MTNFILGLITLIVIALTAYIFINPKSEKLSKSIVTTQQVKKTEVSPKQIEAAIVRTKVVNISPQPMAKSSVVTTKKTVEIVPQNIPSNTVGEVENTIGEDFILDTIKDISEEVKEHIRDDMIYHQEIHAENFESLSDEEIQKTIHIDSK